MLCSVWWGMKFVPGGHATFFGFLNSFVHIPMYLYYFLAAWGPHMNKYLFWKKYMTAFQMVCTNLLRMSYLQSNFRFNSLQFLSIRSNCSSGSAISRKDSSSGLELMQFFSGSFFLIFTPKLTTNNQEQRLYNFLSTVTEMVSQMEKWMVWMELRSLVRRMKRVVKMILKWTTMWWMGKKTSEWSPNEWMVCLLFIYFFH